ncbi:MAG: type II toxin-antitoxin system HicA family toxin [Promicromonosporaceae bacterium]|nr:type II toxin-antitoxin system HicA family toxin [Promicromonosporaceae bacterium]
MVASQLTRKVQRELRDAGFEPQRTQGSHTWWKHADGTTIAVPDGHKEISAGVYRKIVKAITATKEAK